MTDTSTWNTVRAELAEMLADELCVDVIPNPPRSVSTSPTIFFRQFTLAPSAQGATTGTCVLVLTIPHTDDAVFDALGEFVDGDKSIVAVIEANGDLDHGTARTDGDLEIESIEIGGSMCAALAVTVSLDW